MSYIPINPASLLNSPVFTGDPRAPTPSAGDNDTSLATTAFVAAAVSAGGTFVDAPIDGSLYGRRNAGWTQAAPLASPALTGSPTAPTPTPGDNAANIATTAFVAAAVAGGGGAPPATVPPLMDGAQAVGTATKYAREDHVHPSDTSRASVTYVDTQDAFKAPLSSPSFTGTPAAPTATAGANTSQIATTAFVTTAVASRAPLDSPVFTGNPTAPTPTVGDNDTSIATTAFVTAAISAASSNASTGDWMFSTTTSVPPASGQIRLDNASQNLATHMYISNITATGVDATELLKISIKSGATLMLQDKDDGTKYVTYTASGSPTLASGYMDVPLTFVEMGTPVPAQRALLTVVGLSGGGATVPPATVPPLMDGVAAVGTTTKYAREDHVHPSDTSRASVTYVDTQDALKAPLASPALTGTPTAPTATGGTNTTQVATTAFVAAAVAAGGTFVDAPSDGSLYGRLNAGWTKAAPLASPVLTGTPAAPTATGGTNTTQIATTAFVTAAITASGAPAPATVAPIVDSVAAVGVATKYAREDHVHPLSYTAAALTKTDDTNVTLTLGGTPATALLKASSLTLGWTGTLSTTRGGLGLNAGASNGVPIFAAGSVTMTAAAALSRTNDTNVTMTLGGTPTTALLAATSMTLGWTGTLASGRGGLGLDASASNGVPLFATGAVTMTATTGTGNFVRAADPALTGNPTAPTPTAGDNDTSIATTAFVTSAITTAVVPATATPIMDATGTVGTATKYAREDHIHPKSWTQLTQAAYDALTPPNANMLYIIVG